MPSPSRLPSHTREQEQLLAPAQIATLAATHLETVIRILYLRHGFDAYNPFLIQACVLLSEHALRNIEACRREQGQTSQASSFTHTNVSAENSNINNSNTEISTAEMLQFQRSLLILCAQGIWSQAQNFYLSTVTYRVLRQRLAPSEVATVDTFVPSDRARAEVLETAVQQHFNSQWPIPIGLVTDNPDLSTLDTLVKQYRLVSLDDEQDIAEDASVGSG